MLLFKKRLDTRSDEELLALYKKKPSIAIIGRLYQRHVHKLYGLCLSYLKHPQDAEDAVMDSFATLPPKLLKYDIDDFENWLYLVVRNYCLKLLKDKSRHRTDGLDEICKDVFVESAHDEALYKVEEEEQRYEALSDAIDQLNDAQRQCIILFYLKSCSYQDVVEQTGFSLNQVKSHIQNGRRNLKNNLLKVI